MAQAAKVWRYPWPRLMELTVRQRKLSANAIYEYLPTRLVRDRTVIIGDAAHIVTPMTGAGLINGFLDVLALTRQLAASIRIADGLQMRERIEPLLLRYSMPQLTQEVIDRAARLTDDMEAAEDIDTFLRLDREFHFLTFSGASTIVLGDTVERLWNMTQLYRRAFALLLDARSIGIAHDEHHMLVRALRADDVDQAELVQLSHIRRTRQHLARHPEVFEAAAAGWNTAVVALNTGAQTRATGEPPAWATGEEAGRWGGATIR